jgi:hypothetical protein
LLGKVGLHVGGADLSIRLALHEMG